MKKKGIQESDRLTAQQKENGGAERIFGESAQVHEQAVHSVSEIVLRRLQQKYPKLSFRYRNSIPKKEINALLSRNFSEQRKLRIHNGFRHLGHEIIVENFI